LLISFPYNHMLLWLWLDKVCCMNPDPRGQVVVEGYCRCNVALREWFG
jgi:hypothetical protein